MEKKDHSMSYTIVSQCNKEWQINDMVTAIWVIYDLTEIEHIQKDGKKRKLRELRKTDGN